MTAPEGTFGTAVKEAEFLETRTYLRGELDVVRGRRKEERERGKGWRKSKRVNKTYPAA